MPNAERTGHILIRGGRVIDPSRALDETADVLLADGVIADIASETGKLSAGSGATTIDAEGCIVSPGLLDVHVHFREPSGGKHEETIASGSAAALSGGFTCTCCMPNTLPALDTPEAVKLVLDKAAAADGARVLPTGCATAGRRGEQVSDIAALAQAGAIAITDDGDCVDDDAVMAQALSAAKAADRCFMQHCQDSAMTEGAAMNAGPVAERLGLIGWPREAEERIILRDIELNRDIGCRYHAQHLSSGASAAIIRKARAEGQPVTGELAPHHLLLTEEECERIGTNAKMNPPLRAKEDINLLKEAAADGTITVLATDHAPHPAATKDRPFAEAAFGIVGLECALPLYAEALIHDGVMDWPAMLAMMTINPARLIGLDRVGLGTLLPGSPADVTIIDPSLAWTIDAEQFASTGRNCPFHGRSVTGRAIATIVAGRIRMDRAGQRVSG
jgi:dihydroorotase